MFDVIRETAFILCNFLVVCCRIKTNTNEHLIEVYIEVRDADQARGFSQR